MPSALAPGICLTVSITAIPHGLRAGPVRSIVRELMERTGGQASAQIAGDMLEIKLPFRGA